MLLNPHTAVNSSAHTAGMVLIAGTVFAWALSLRLLSEALFAALGLWLSVWLSLGLGILGLLGLYKPPSSSKVSFAGSLQREAGSGRTCVLLPFHHWDTRVPGSRLHKDDTPVLPLLLYTGAGQADSSTAGCTATAAAGFLSRIWKKPSAC